MRTLTLHAVLLSALLLAAAHAPSLAASGGRLASAPNVHQEYVAITAQAGMGGFLHAGFLGNATTGGAFVEIMGPGMCWLDADTDGKLDLFLVNGRYHTEPEKEANLRPTSHLYRNVGGGQFTDATEAAGVALRAWGMGCAAADFDNDGDADLFVANYGGDTLYRNDGGVFANVTAQLGVVSDCSPYPCWSTSATWFDADRDGCMDLYVSRFGNWTFEQGGGNGPANAPEQRDQFFGGACGGAFVDRTESAGFSTHANTWSAVAYDVNDDLWPDLYVSNDLDPNELWINDGDGTFTHVVNGAENDRTGMGTAVGDLDHDGDVDLVTTNFVNANNGIFLQQPNGSFVDVGGEIPFDDAFPWSGWATLMSDVDHDGREDLSVVNGLTEDITRMNPNAPTEHPFHVYRQLASGAFAQINRTLGAPASGNYVGRGAAWADLDDDGDLDLALAEAGERPTHLWRMDRAPGNFLAVTLVGTAPGVTRDAEGARVTLSADGIPALAKEKRAQQGFLSSNDPRVHFGLGRAASADLVIRWPDGSTQSFAAVPANAFVRVVQGNALEVLARRPIPTASGPDVIERLVPAAFAATLDAPLARAEWDFGDGSFATCDVAEGVCKALDGAVVGSIDANGAALEHAFLSTGPYETLVALTDAAGRIVAQRIEGRVTSPLYGNLTFDQPRYDQDDVPRGLARVRYSDMTPVADVNVIVTIERSFWQPAEDAALPLLPRSVRALAGYYTLTLEGTTNAQGEWEFEVPLWWQSPVAAARAVDFNPIGDYAANLSGTYRSSTIVNATTSYQVIPSAE